MDPSSCRSKKKSEKFGKSITGVHWILEIDPTWICLNLAEMDRFNIAWKWSDLTNNSNSFPLQNRSFQTDFLTNKIPTLAQDSWNCSIFSFIAQLISKFGRKLVGNCHNNQSFERKILPSMNASLALNQTDQNPFNLFIHLRVKREIWPKTLTELNIFNWQRFNWIKFESIAAKVVQFSFDKLPGTL